MSTSTNGIATWGDISATYVNRGTPTSKCPTKDEIVNATKSDYTANFGQSYDSDQLVKYTDLSFSANVFYLTVTGYSGSNQLYVNYDQRTVSAYFGLSFTGTGTATATEKYSGYMTISGSGGWVITFNVTNITITNYKFTLTFNSGTSINFNPLFSKGTTSGVVNEVKLHTSDYKYLTKVNISAPMSITVSAS